MKLNVKALALAAGVFWAAMMFLIALAHLWWGYGAAFLELMDGLYPGYHAGGGWGSVIVGTLYALVDGLVAGAVLGWLYNRFATQPQRRE